MKGIQHKEPHIKIRLVFLEDSFSRVSKFETISYKYWNLPTVHPPPSFHIPARPVLTKTFRPGHERPPIVALEDRVAHDTLARVSIM